MKERGTVARDCRNCLAVGKAVELDLNGEIMNSMKRVLKGSLYFIALENASNQPQEMNLAAQIHQALRSICIL